MGGGVQRPFGLAQKNGCAQRTGVHARPKPTSFYISMFFDIYVCAKAQHEALTVVHQENAGYIAVLLPRICLSAS